jgi:hypothetical protein
MTLLFWNLYNPTKRPGLLIGLLITLEEAKIRNNSTDCEFTKSLCRYIWGSNHGTVVPTEVYFPSFVSGP